MRLQFSVALICATVSLFAIAGAEDPYRFFNWNVTYGDIFPLGVRQTGILINGQFPGPDIHSVTNDNLIINALKAQLDGGNKLPFPDGILINGRGPGGASFNVEQVWTEGNGHRPVGMDTTSVTLSRVVPLSSEQKAKPHSQNPDPASVLCSLFSAGSVFPFLSNTEHKIRLFYVH
ncbi:hypothetical protein V6N13_011661 [Hibiscus sabdariffa]